MPTVSELLSQNIGNTIMNVQTWNGVVYNVLAFGAKGDGVTDDSGKIADAIAKASVNGGVLLFPPGTYVIGTNLTFPSNVTAEFSNGAKLSINAGITVTFNGPINAGLYQIFSGDGTVSGSIKVPFVVPQWWGATGNGVSDDTSSIQKAVNAGAVVYIPSGVYIVSNTIIISRYNTVIKGNGRDITIIKAMHSTGDIFQVSSGIKIESLSIDSGVSRTSGFAIGRNPSYKTQLSLLLIRDLYILNQFSGIDLSGTLDVIDNVEIRNTSSQGYGVLIDGGTDQTINHLIIDNEQQILAGIYVKSTGALFLSNCDIIHGGYALYISPSSGEGVFSVYVNNCYFDNSINGLKISGSGTPMRFKFTNCWFCSHIESGISINNINADAIDFTNCYIMGNQADGVTTQSASSWAISHSTFTGNTGSGISLFHTSGNFKIHGNKIGATQEFSGNSFAIFFNSTGNYEGYISVENNDVYGNINGSIILPTTTASKMKITNNTGYNPVGILTSPSVPASGTAYTNNFNVRVRVFVSGGTVSNIAINGTNTGLTSGMFELDPGETITLTYTAAPTWVWLGL